VFARLSASEMAMATELAEDAASSILPFDVGGRLVVLTDKNLASDGMYWMAVLCPKAYIKRSKTSTDLKFCVPANSIPTPYIARTATARVTVVTPCCGDPLPGVPIYIAERWAGVTGAKGSVDFRLPPGKHSVTAPNHSYAKEMIDIQPDFSSDETAVRIRTSGELFLYLQDMSVDDEVKDGVMLCANRSNIPEDSKRFVGSASLGPCSLGKTLCVRPGARCSEGLRRLKVTPADGRKYLPIDDLTWFDDFKDECQVCMLFTGTPLRLGNLLGTPCQSAARLSGGMHTAPRTGSQSDDASIRSSTLNSSRPSSVAGSSRPSSAAPGRRKSDDRGTATNAKTRSPLLCPCPRPGLAKHEAAVRLELTRKSSSIPAGGSRSSSGQRRDFYSAINAGSARRERPRSSSGCQRRQASTLFLSESSHEANGSPRGTRGGGRGYL